jgi:hypothetical protein
MLKSILLCWAVLIPQIAGGEVPPGFVTVKMSVRHFEALLMSCPVPPATPPVAFPSTASVFEPVDGPVITKDSKSSLS